MNDIADHIDNPHECKHNWQPLSFVFETQPLDSEGRVNIRQPGIDHGRVYLVCLRCCLHTYMVTQWAGFQLEGSDHRARRYHPSSSGFYTDWPHDTP